MTIAKAASGLCLLGLAGLVGIRLFISDPVPAATAATVESSSPQATLSHPVEHYQGSFLQTSQEAMLSDLQVHVYPEDVVTAFPDPSLGLGSHLVVQRAQSVLIKDGNEEKLVRTWAKTVQELADEQKLELAEKDKTSLARDAAIPDQEQLVTLTITRVAESELITTSAIAYTTKKVDDPTMLKGETKVTQAGKNGVLKKTFLVVRENGVKVAQTLIKSERTQEPGEEVLAVGTKVISYGDGGASWYEGIGGEYTAAHKTLPFGTKVRVTNKSNGKSIVVTITDRGPYVNGRIIDLSRKAFAAIASLGSGVAQVTLEKE